uniref:Uncharacterized protein n=1 Tax=Anopheles maculatus TaxID=74869 RepID=A0A182S5M5_9DIPT
MAHFLPHQIGFGKTGYWGDWPINRSPESVSIRVLVVVIINRDNNQTAMEQLVPTVTTMGDTAQIALIQMPTSDHRGSGAICTVAYGALIFCLMFLAPCAVSGTPREAPGWILDGSEP